MIWNTTRTCAASPTHRVNIFHIKKKKEKKISSFYMIFTFTALSLFIIIIVITYSTAS